MLQVWINWFRPEKIIHEFLRCSKILSASRDFLNEFEMICLIILVLEDLANLVRSKKHICWRIVLLSKYIILMHTLYTVSGCFIEHMIDF